MTIRKSFIVSTAVHITPILLLALLGGQGGIGDGKNKNGVGEDQTNNNGSGKHKDAGNIIPKPEEATPTVVELVARKTPSKVKKKKQVTKKSNKDCPEYFGGIGITHGPMNIVLDAPEGYPAAEAGIKKGDILLSPVESIRGPIGTEVTVLYKNEDGVHEVTIIRGKICTSGTVVAPMRDGAKEGE
jgi:hypothetical protein